MRNFLKNLLPKKNHFIGVDIGAYQIKAAEVKIVDGFPEVVNLKSIPSPKNVWNGQIDEENLVQALKDMANPVLKEVITCIGGEKVVSRVVRLPYLSDKELESAAKFEIQKFVPTPVDQLIIRYVRLSDAAFGALEAADKKGEQEGQDVLLLAVPLTTVYQYHSIFSRAGMVVTAADLQAFALWRVFGRNVRGTAAIVDFGAKTSHFVLVKDGVIKFVRLLPVGCEVLTDFIMNTYDVDYQEAMRILEEVDTALRSDYSQESRQGKEESPEDLTLQMEEAAASLENDYYAQPTGRTVKQLRDVISEITKELRRSLSFYFTQENIAAEKIILSGGMGHLKGFVKEMQSSLEIPVEIGVPEIEFAADKAYDPVYAISIGLALRELII
ncbi:type IV pilus assembly protein PilM [Pelotomaculum propionicicum]|uniref:Cell division protein FtsA n=1 Tax=Pelotomaculum propionicicum TaxID=258475 RepID=A0A4Y7RMQ2_9FIRM|nr:type IV pilus assembly protein PilM [Pelotomaculum propionicicum]NLI11358.1 type IV pilus assembly protein PilM [Peptococcaceae bacterium]TEB09577.1 Cell division protein FtsA [Pelotomaculum propionicicum]